MKSRFKNFDLGIDFVQFKFQQVKSNFLDCQPPKHILVSITQTSGLSSSQFEPAVWTYLLTIQIKVCTKVTNSLGALDSTSNVH